MSERFETEPLARSGEHPAYADEQPARNPSASGSAGQADETMFSRLEMVWGRAGIERLKRARVAVFGCGGVGSNCIEALARGGVGHLVIVDGDAVAPSNINRQAIAYLSTIGKRKVDVMRSMISLINRDARVWSHDCFVRANEAANMLETIRSECGGTLDFIVDAIDTVSTKIAVAAWADREHVPLISSMGGANKLDPSALEICDIFETTYDPLARAMRKQCRKQGIRRLTVLSSTEQPVTCTGTGLGTASYLPPIMGQTIAGYVIRSIVGGA